jgi:hypothetical protein
MTKITNTKSDHTPIQKGWNAFVNGDKCLGYREFKDGGKYWGKLTLITKPTEAELKAELTRLKISLPK